MLALAQTTKESLYVSRLLKELSVRLDNNRVQIQCDNYQTIRLVTAEIAVLQTRLRHVDIHNHWLRQEVLNGTIKVVYTPSNELMADGLTKPLQGTMFKAFIDQIGLVDITEQLEQRGLLDMTAEDLEDEIQRQVEELVEANH